MAAPWRHWSGSFTRRSYPPHWCTMVVREPRRLTYRVQRSGGRGTEEKEREKREREEKGEKGEKGVVVEQKEEERGILDR